MSDAERLVISLDPELKSILKEYRKKTGKNQTDIVRGILVDYFEQSGGDIMNYDPKKAGVQYDMLSSGEHIILDIDHWILFLKFIEGTICTADFWDSHRRIARSHADQLKGQVQSMEDVLRRLEICNLFEVRKVSEKKFTLIPGTEPSKEFLRVLLMEIAEGLGYEMTIKEDFSKLRIEL